MEFTNKSVVLQRFGGYDCLQVDKHPLPPLDGNIEVKVAYCSLNFADIYTRLGLIPKEFPFVPGIECAGVVSALGVNDSEFKVGDQVICYNHNGGLYSDVIRINPSKCYKIPNNLDLKIATTLFVNYLTAYFSLFKIGNLQDNDTIFISSCAGGLGWAATQLARTKSGVKIIGTASNGKSSIVKENGVDYVVNHNDLAKLSEKLDLILETQYGENTKILESLLKPFGKLVILGANGFIQNPDHLVFSAENKHEISALNLIQNNTMFAGLHLGVLTENSPQLIRQTLDVIIELLGKSKINPRIDSIWEINSIVDATKQLAERKNIGKVLCKMN